MNLKLITLTLKLAFGIIFLIFLIAIGIDYLFFKVQPTNMQILMQIIFLFNFYLLGD
jgi:hypothetical protein